MPRIRTIKPEFFRSVSLSRCEPNARLTFAGLWCWADDYGRYRYEPQVLKADVWPYDEAVTWRHVTSHVDALLGVDVLCEYEADGRRYLHVTHWAEHQKVDHPSKKVLPPCPRDTHGGPLRPAETEPSRGPRESSVSPRELDGRPRDTLEGPPAEQQAGPTPPGPNGTAPEADARIGEPGQDLEASPPDSSCPPLPQGSRDFHEDSPNAQGVLARDSRLERESRSETTEANTSVEQARPEPGAPDPVAVVFEAWKQSTGRPRANLGGATGRKRRALIQRALKDYPLEDVLAAVQGWKRSAHHRGENSRRTVYNDLELLLRDAEHIERFRDLHLAGSNGHRGTTGPSAPAGAFKVYGRTERIAL